MKNQAEKSGWKLWLAVLLILPLLGVVGTRLYSDIMFDRDCEGHIKRAADANTVELAKQELGVVVNYLSAHWMTDGHTSVLYNTPDEDVGYWYQNLKASLGELERVRPETAQLERTNLLMKLRQTLLDHKGTGESVTVPAGISVFPHNHAYFLALVATVLLLIPSAFLLKSRYFG